LGTAQKWASNGKLQTAQKLGRDWFIDDAEPIPPDRRYVENPIRNRRKGEHDYVRHLIIEDVRKLIDEEPKEGEG
jgi:hypothetical protein